jgi:predicted nucleic acid-binding protein
LSVVDASVLVEFLTKGEYAEAAEDAIGRERWVWAPALIDAEVGNALRRLVRLKQIGPRRAGAALDDFLDMRIQRIPHRSLIERAWQLRDNVTFYDALYVALAEALGAPLLTRDARLSRAPGVRAEVELVGPA